MPLGLFTFDPLRSRDATGVGTELEGIEEEEFDALTAEGSSVARLFVLTNSLAEGRPRRRRRGKSDNEYTFIDIVSLSCPSSLSLFLCCLCPLSSVSLFSGSLILCLSLSVSLSKSYLLRSTHPPLPQSLSRPSPYCPQETGRSRWDSSRYRGVAGHEARRTRGDRAVRLPAH